MDDHLDCAVDSDNSLKSSAGRGLAYLCWVIASTKNKKKQWQTSAVKYLFWWPSKATGEDMFIGNYRTALIGRIWCFKDFSDSWSMLSWQSSGPPHALLLYMAAYSCKAKVLAAEVLAQRSDQWHCLDVLKSSKLIQVLGTTHCNRTDKSNQRRSKTDFPALML